MLVYKELHDWGQRRVLGAAQTCQVLHQIRMEFCFLLFYLKVSGLGIFLHLRVIE